MKLKQRPTNKLLFILFVFIHSGILFSASNNLTLLKPVHPDDPNYSGDKQTCICSNQCPLPIRAQLVDSVQNTPQANTAVIFSIVHTPDQQAGGSLNHHIAYTDSLGIAETTFQPDNAAGQYLISASTALCPTPITYEIQVWKKNWFLFLLMGLAGGLGLFLLGMYLMGEGMQKSAGNRMRAILSKMAHNRFVATGVGAFITMIIQSSSATVVMLMSFVNSKLMRFEQTTGFILGACIGTTITAQIIAFNITDYALLIIAIGFSLRALSGKPGIQYLGEGILGFGILFFGMGIMSEAMYPLRSYEPFLSLLTQLENPITGIIIGALFTGIIQSSSAAIGIFIITASQGLLTLETSIPLILGANIGTVFTAFLASLGASSETRKVAVAEAFIKLTGVLAIAWWIPEFTALIRELSPATTINENIHQFDHIGATLPRQIANAHTLFNVLITLLILPFIKQFNHFINYITRRRNQPTSGVETTNKLEDSLLGTPSLAIQLIKEKLAEMGNLCIQMIAEMALHFESREQKHLDRITQLERETDQLAMDIKSYLLDISSRNITPFRSNEAFLLLYASKEYEQIGDILSNNLLNKGQYWQDNPELHFSNEGKEEIAVLFQKTKEQIKRSITIIKDQDTRAAKELKNKAKHYHQLSIYFEQKHFERLQDSQGTHILKSKIHLEITSMLNAVIRHTDNIARLVIEETKKESNPKNK